jgi:hypothetical protein
MDPSKESMLFSKSSISTSYIPTTCISEEDYGKHLLTFNCLRPQVTHHFDSTKFPHMRIQLHGLNLITDTLSLARELFLNKSIVS